MTQIINLIYITIFLKVFKINYNQIMVKNFQHQTKITIYLMDLIVHNIQILLFGFKTVHFIYL